MPGSIYSNIIFVLIVAVLDIGDAKLYKPVVVLAGGAVNNSRKVYCSRCDVMVVGVNG